MVGDARRGARRGRRRLSRNRAATRQAVASAAIVAAVRRLHPAGRARARGRRVVLAVAGAGGARRSDERAPSARSPWHAHRPQGHARARRRRAGRGRRDHRHRRRPARRSARSTTDEEGRLVDRAARAGPVHRHARPRHPARRRRPAAEGGERRVHGRPEPEPRR